MTTEQTQTQPETRTAEVRSDALLNAGNALAQEAAALVVAVRSELARSTLHGRRGVVQICGDLITLIDRWDDASTADSEFSDNRIKTHNDNRQRTAFSGTLNGLVGNKVLSSNHL